MSIGFDSVEMAQRGRIGAHTTLSRHDPHQLTSRAREAFLTTFEKQVDPDGTLPPEERRRRAEHALKAHMTRLARRSALARKEVANVA
jgi:hypothetical protein